MREKISCRRKTAGKQQIFDREPKLRGSLILCSSYKTSYCDETFEVGHSVSLISPWHDT